MLPADGSTASSRLTASTRMDPSCSDLFMVESWPSEIFDSKILTLSGSFETAHRRARTFCRLFRLMFLERLPNIDGTGSKAYTVRASLEKRTVKYPMLAPTSMKVVFLVINSDRIEATSPSYLPNLER